MKRITFCLFTTNDDKLEQGRLLVCLNSLLNQDTDESKIIFFDCTPKPNTFKLPKHEDLTVIHHPIKDFAKFNRSVIRNNMAVKVDTEFMCQTCADVCFSPNFASTLINKMGKEKKMLICHRRLLGEKDWDRIRKTENPIDEISKVWNKIRLNKYKYANDDYAGAVGECQCMNTKHFIKIGGYYQLIENGVPTEGSWSATAAKDDTNLGNFYRYNNIKMGTIEKEPDVWLVHLWHGIRINARKWNTKDPQG